MKAGGEELLTQAATLKVEREEMLAADTLLKHSQTFQREKGELEDKMFVPLGPATQSSGKNITAH